MRGRLRSPRQLAELIAKGRLKHRRWEYPRVIGTAGGAGEPEKGFFQGEDNRTPGILERRVQWRVGHLLSTPQKHGAPLSQNIGLSKGDF